MTNQSVSVGFSSASSTSSDIWATLEQEYDGSDNEASLTDLYHMLAYGRAGTSSLEYLIRTCPYVTITEEEVTITLNVYVWPHSLDLEYDITCTEGVASAGELQTIDKSFDVIIDNSSSAVLPYVLDGEATPQTPYINQYGKLLDFSEPEIVGSLVTIDANAFVVLRVEGSATGFKHSVTLTYDIETIISEDFKVNAADNVVTLSYTNEEGELQTIQETLDIPACVTQILEYCGVSLYWNISAGGAGRYNSIEIYVDECKGGVILIREVDKEGKTVGYPYV
jgi:hypothetical protein